jgi:hypothetical protein
VWFSKAFTGEIKFEWDLQIFLSVIEGFEDIKLLRDNTPLWCATKKWKDGFGPTAENYLKKRQFKDCPKGAAEPPKPIDVSKLKLIPPDDILGRRFARLEAEKLEAERLAAQG